MMASGGKRNSVKKGAVTTLMEGIGAKMRLRGDKEGSEKSRREEAEEAEEEEEGERLQTMAILPSIREEARTRGVI